MTTPEVHTTNYEAVKKSMDAIIGALDNVEAPAIDGMCASLMVALQGYSNGEVQFTSEEQLRQFLMAGVKFLEEWTIKLVVAMKQMEESSDDGA